VAGPERTWVVLPFRGDALEKAVAPILQQALFQGRGDLLQELVMGYAFPSEALQRDAEARLSRLTDQIAGGAIDYLGEGPYPAHWRMDAVRGVFHYAGTSPWCFDAYRLLLDLCVVDPPPAGWSAAFPEPAPGSLDAGGSLWDFFGDLSNESYDLDAFMGKLFDSLPVWVSPPESTFTGFLNERDVLKLKAMVEALGEGRRARSFNLREFHGYLTRAAEHKVGLTAAAIPAGEGWQDEKPLTDDKKWLKR
jgi:hypothetical protein